VNSLSHEKNKEAKKEKPTSRVQTKQNKKRRKKLIFFTGLLGLCLVLLCILPFKNQIALTLFKTIFSKDIAASLNESYQPIDQNTTRLIKDNEPYSLLLLGIDQRGKEPARSDAIIYAVVRPKDNKLLLISIPRDSYVEIVGKNKPNKINAAHAFGGAKMSVDTVEKFVGNPVDYYATINFRGLIDVVDTIGGIKLPITKNIVNKSKYHEKFTIEANKPKYFGTEALNYVRYREDSDFNRTARQRTFIGAMINEMKSIKNITKIDDLIKIAGENFKTNMKADEITKMAESLIQSSPEIMSYMLEGSDKKINGIYYYMPKDSSVTAIQSAIKSWLDPSSEAADLETLNPAKDH